MRFIGRLPRTVGCSWKSKPELSYRMEQVILTIMYKFKVIVLHKTGTTRYSLLKVDNNFWPLCPFLHMCWAITVQNFCS